MATPVADLVNTSALPDSGRAIRSLVAGLKPHILQAPKANNTAIRVALEEIGEIKANIQLAEEITDSLSLSDVDPSIGPFQWQLQALCE
ncbi:hypothetical protein FRC07_012829 [Ceratobasidium sp. 392]|nr:hypothetical protein FRC07_012829 [Ceratobasidium sp. 392]